MPQTIMIQGTTSDAGKSTLVAALCRIFARKGISVAPFKPQNMALNSAVTEDGGEIGRAQAVQAEAARIAPHTDMNPVLIKPSSDTGAQVIIHGKAIQQMDAVDFHQYKTTAMSAVQSSYNRLCQRCDTIFVEGAGSPAEINLRDRDIANMGFAEAVDCPVILIADIDRGGVFAHIVGTLALLSESERNRVLGFVINRFRGDISLLQSGLDWLEKETGKPVLGVLPYIHGLHIEAEDAITANSPAVANEKSLKVIVPAIPRISNHTDFDALRLHPNVDFEFIGPDHHIPSADLIILPGSKSVCSDLQFLRDQGWEAAINKHLRYGGKLIGICGGYQMLGKVINDPECFESKVDSIKGMSYFDFETTLNGDKQLINRKGEICLDGEVAPVKGYEIHQGITKGSALDNSIITFLDNSNKTIHEGCISEDNQIFGTYLHGLFDNSAALELILSWAGLSTTSDFYYEQLRSSEFDRLADEVEQAIDWERWNKAINTPYA